MHVHDRMEVLHGHICKGFISENSGIVDNNINRAESVDCVIYDALRRFEFRHRVGIRYRRTAQADYFINGGLGGVIATEPSLTGSDPACFAVPGPEGRIFGIESSLLRI